MGRVEVCIRAIKRKGDVILVRSRSDYRSSLKLSGCRPENNGTLEYCLGGSEEEENGKEKLNRRSFRCLSLSVSPFHKLRRRRATLSIGTFVWGELETAFSLVVGGGAGGIRCRSYWPCRSHLPRTGPGSILSHLVH